ncbi:MAG: SpoIID/LytB domain-containing protein [Phycisphaerae bacterium]
MHAGKDARPQLGFSTVCLSAAVALAGVCGCSTRGSPDLTSDVPPPPALKVRDIRVVIASGSGPLRFRAGAPYAVRDDHGQTLEHGTDPGWVNISGSDRLSLGKRSFRPHRLHLVPEAGTTFELASYANGRWSAPRRYAGTLTLLRRSDKVLLAINEVDLDTYVAGVLCHELYPEFHREAFRAQAVAARTYALYQMSLRAGQDYDVTNTQLSQVYGGLAKGRAAGRAVEAANYTRGIVCTWTSPAGQRIFCTYYCSACGGRTQSAADFLGKPTVPPLAGGVRCDYCRIARGDVYRWGPVNVDRAELNARLKVRYPGLMKKLGAVQRVEVLARTDTDRIARVRLTGPDGKLVDMLGERFRLVVGSQTMRSTACYLDDAGDRLMIFDGRGFGHGVGLCQWGAHGQALQGRTAAQILKFYYPGANLTKAY